MDQRILFIGLMLQGCVGEVGECPAGKMREILNRFSGEERCQPRSTIIQLPEPGEQYSHVTPTHLEVTRCSGSCMQSYHKCLPGTVVKKSVKVLLSVRSAVPGPAATVCGEVEVEEHTSCTCGCPVTADQCTARQLFLPSECRCTCANSRERDQCIGRGWHWNPDLCQCMCPNRPYPTCPTGYIFDHEDTCMCRAFSYGAFTVVELVVVVLSLGTLCSVISLFQCYRKGIGLFKHRREVRFRTDSFKSKVRSLSERLDRSVTGRVREESPAEGEELVNLNSSPDRSVSM